MQPNNAQAPDRLLDRLLHEGVLPRYAFPSDNATFYVFDVEQSSSYRPVFRHSPQQGLNIALTGYAPGKRLWIDNAQWESGAIYSPFADERHHAWQRRRLYMECQVCHYARTDPFETARRHHTETCPACGAEDRFGPARTWFRPPGFAHPVDLDLSNQPDQALPPSYATRAKLFAATPEDQDFEQITPGLHVYTLRDRLLITNRGPRNEGYHYCTRCGRIHPAASHEANLLAEPHRKPFPTSTQEQICPGGFTALNIVLGTEMISDLMLISLRTEPPVQLLPGRYATRSALRTLTEAFARAACDLLEIEATELEGEFRPALNENGPIGREAEIYLYDTLPGGAGFAHAGASEGRALFERALQLLEQCPEKENCDKSCYRCLRRFQNRIEHHLLDRHLGASLLRYLLDGTMPEVAHDRRDTSIDLLYNDLLRQVGPDLVERDGTLSVAGEVISVPILLHNSEAPVAIDLHHPLCPEVPLHAEFERIPTQQRRLVDELLVRQNLPRATSAALAQS